MRRGWWQTRDTLDTATDHITRQRLPAEPNAPWQFWFLFPSRPSTLFFSFPHPSLSPPRLLQLLNFMSEQLMSCWLALFEFQCLKNNTLPMFDFLVSQPLWVLTHGVMVILLLFFTIVFLFHHQHDMIRQKTPKITFDAWFLPFIWSS